MLYGPCAPSQRVTVTVPSERIVEEDHEAGADEPHDGERIDPMEPARRLILQVGRQALSQ